MKINELKGKTLITQLPVDADQYDKVAPGNRIDGKTYHQADDVDKAYIDDLRRLAGLTLGTGKDKGDMDSPLTHGGSEKGEYQQKHHIEPGTEDWFKLWFSRPRLTGENPYGN
jgi:hypothetical protein